MHIFRSNKIIVSILLLTVTITIGAIGFSVIDDYPPIDALYMAVITISTVGFGEIYPLSDLGRLFAIVFILISFVVLGFVGHSVFESLLEKVWSGNASEKKMKKEIALLTNHCVICGFGRVGEVAANHLKDAGADFVVIEKSERGKEACKEAGLLFVEGDATRESVLLQAGIKNASGLLAMVNSDPLNLFIVLTARELNPTLHIIARSEDKNTEKKILRAGADSIISPFDSAGQKIASDILSETSSGVISGQKKDSPGKLSEQMITVSAESQFAGKSIGEIKRSRINVLGLRRDGVDSLYPERNEIIIENDQLLILTADEQPFFSGSKAVKKKIVIIDDNPVIIRLFSRLFQKEGYHPVSAEDAESGLELIIKEKPDIAVIDYMLPGMSGVDLCSRIKAIGFNDNLKLVVFTAENDPIVKQQCYEAGANAVIVKSADAREIIKTVSGLVS